MNRHCYRLIFNKLKGRWVVASEAASSEGQEGVATPRCHIPPAPVVRCPLLVSFRPLTWSVLLALGLVAVPVHAQIAPDRSAPGDQRPHVVNSANGTPQVNITSPNAKGVSRNAYRQFDVDGKGAILNNARNAASTQIGGWVQGNPNLANGEARVIVNEVNSSNPSRLHGAVEVAGRRAEVVIANPAGIDVDGAGFINAQGITLTTGQPQYRNGALEGYRVEGGSVRIHGDGFDAGDADYAAILTRAAEVQAGVWAEELEVVTGANRISADRQAIDTIDGRGAVPEVAIDVAHLGGMYAGKIHLMATERGVGVHHAGDMAAGEIVVAADGRITNRGQIAAQGDMQLASRDAIANHGSLRAGDTLVVTSDGELANRDSGTITARNDIQLSAATLSSDSDSLLAAGVRDDGTWNATGDLTMSATQGIDGSGQHIAAGGFYAQAETVALRDSHTQARKIDIAAGQAGIDASGATLSAQETLNTRTPGTLRTDGASVAAARLTLDVGSLSNIGGDIVQHGEKSLALRLDALDNTSGRVASKSGLDIAAQTIDNTDGTLQALDDFTLNAGRLNNRDGDIVAGADLAVEASGDIDNTQGQWRAQRIDIAASGLDNTAGLISAHGGDLYAQLDELDNTQGRLETAGDLRLDIADTLTNETGEIIHAGQGEANIDASRVEGSDGLIASQGRLALRGEDIVLDGAATSAESLALSAESLSHRQGEMQQFGDADDLMLTIGQSLDNTEGLIAGNAGLEITAQALTNTAGILQAVDDLTLNAGSLNNRDGDIVAGASLAVEASGDIDNTQGQWRAERIDIAGSELDNTAGLISAHGGELNAQLDELDNTQGRLETAGDLRLDIAGTLTNETGEIIHAAQGEAQIEASRVEGSDGLIVSQGRLALRGEDIVLDGAATSAESIALNAENLSHRRGEMQQFGDADDLTLSIGQALDNSEGLIAGNAGLNITAQELTNTAGILQAVGDLTLNAGRLNNRDGDIVAGADLAVEASGDIDNTQGQWRAERIDIAGSGLDNTAGLISAHGGELNAQLDELDNTQGRLETAGDLRLDIAGTLTNETGEIIHVGAGESSIAANRVEGSEGLIASQGRLALRGEDIVLDGAATSAESIALNAENLSHRRGEMQQFGDADDLTLSIGQALDNSEGLIVGNAGLNITAQNLTNTAGTLQAVDDLTLNAGRLNNRDGDIVAGGALAVEASGDIDNTQGQWRAERIDIAASGLDNTAGLISAHGGELNAQLDELNNTEGRLESAGDLTLDIADTLTNVDGDIVHAGDGMAQIDATHIAGSDGLIVSQSDLTLDARDIVLDGATTSAESIALHAENLSHRRGEMQQFGDADDLTLNIGQSLDNSGGLIAGNAGLEITALALSNTAGTLQAVDDLTINAGSLNNRDGDIVAGGALAVEASGDIDNTQGQWRAERIDVAASGLDNTAGLISAHGGELNAQVAELDNTEGRLEASDDLSLDIADTLTNEAGEIIHVGAGEASIAANRVEGIDGLIVSQGDLTLDARDIVLDGAVTSAESIALHAENLSHRQGEMQQFGDADDLTLNIGQALDNSGGLIAGNAGLDITAQALTNTAGTLQAVDDIRLNVGSLNNRDGDIVAGASLAVEASGDIDNTQGQWRAERIDVAASGLDNTAGLISANGGALNAQLAELDNTEGRLEASDDLSLDIADTLINEDGEIIHVGAGEASIAANRVEGSDGLIVSQGDLTLDARDIVLDGAATSAESIALNAESLSHRRGEMQQFGDADDLTLSIGQALDNSEGLIAGNAGLEITAQDLTNTAGILQAVDDLTLNAGNLNNRDGDIVTGGQLSVTAFGSVDNRGGDVIGEQGIALRAASLDNRSGMLGALQGQLTVEAGALDNTQGRVETAGGLTLDIAGTLTNQDGEIVHAGDGEARIDATRLDGSDGLIASQGALMLAADTIDFDGAVTSAKQIAVQARRLSHQRGEMSQYGDEGELLLAIREELDNLEGWIVSHADLSADVGDLVNRSGMLQAAGNLSLDSDELDNRQGEVLAGGSLALDADGRLDNRSGRVVATRDATLSAASLVNVDGLIASLESDLTLNIDGAINNRRGHLEAGGELASLSLGLDNRDGEIVATRGDIDTLGQRLDNRGGLIASRESLDLASGEFDNAGGTLQAGGDLSLDTHGQALRNSDDGTILGEGGVALTAGNLDNTAGLIGAGTVLDLQADTTVNRNGGALLSEADMQLAVASLDNRGGQLQALGDMSLEVDGTLSNQGGLIRAGKTLEVSANQVSNRQTQGDDQGIEANRIQLDAGGLDNRQGTIRADQLADIQVDAGVNNRAGLISSLDTLAIRANDIDNRDGTLIADRYLDLTTAELTGDGRVLSLGDLALRLASDFTLAEGGELMAAGDLHLATSGTIDNQGKLRAGETLDIEAARLINAANGELSGTTTHIDAGRLTNRGLIDGVETYIAADVLDNLGSGRIYGDRLGIEAGILNNDNEDGQAAVIAARERLDLGVGNLLNRDDALIFSAGDMAIGGSLNASGQARGQAGRVRNASATIEALGNLSLSADRLDNTNEHFETELVRVADLPQGIYIQPQGWNEKLSPDEFHWTFTHYSYYRHRDTGTRVSNWTEYDIEGTRYQSQVVQSQPGQILAGGDIHLSGGNLVNDKSRIIAGGAVSGDLNSLSNIEATGERVFEERGTKRQASYSTTRRRESGEQGGYYVYETHRHYTDWEPYTGQSSETFLLPASEVREGSAFSGSGTQLAAHSGASLSASAQGTNGAQVNIQTNRSGASVIEVPALRPPAANAESSLALGDWIASVRGDIEWLAATPAGLLLEAIGTNTATAADVERLAATLADMLGGPTDVDSLTTTDHQIKATDVERLVAALAGLVGESTGTDITDADIERWVTTPADMVQDAVAGDLSAVENPASLGVIRSVMPNITLPANSLFQVNPAPTAHYLVETDPRFTNQREWLGSDYMLNALQSDPSTTHQRLGDGFYEQRLVNEQIIQLTGQRYLAGHGNDDDQYRALMNAGITFAEQHDLRPGVALTAEQMAQLTSDIVWLVEQTVTLDDGSTVEVLVPQVYVRVREGDLQGDGTLIAGNSLALDVADDIRNTGTLAGRELVSLTAENIANLGGRIGGNRVDLDARNDLDNIGGQITAGDSLALQAGRDLTLSSTSERLAGLYVTETGGRLSATAGRDLSVVGADLDSAGDLRLGAGRDLDITSTLSHETRWGGISKSSELEHVATLSAGNDLILDAGRDLTLTAADVSAQGSGLLSAGRDLSLETLTTQESLRSWRNTTRESEEIGTQLEIGGSLALLAGQDITARAAQLDAGDDLTLSAGRDISLDAGRSQQFEETRRGRTHTIDSQTRVQSTTLDAGSDLHLQAGNNLRLTASQLQAGGSAALLAGNRIDLLTAQEEDYSLYESRSSGLFSSRHQRDEVRDIREVGTQISAGNDITLVSGGDQSYRGARLDAGQDLALLSGGNITFDMASDLRTESHERSRSSFVRQSASGEGTTRETLRQNELRYQGELIIQAAQGISIEVEGINAQSVRQTVEAMAAANPDLAWLQEMEQRGDIDWRHVEAIHDSWSYSQSGLGPGAALAVSIVAAAWAGPAASGLLGLAEGGLAAGMVSAGAGSLAGTGAVSVINHGGDLGAALGDTFSSDSLRGAATAALTAGATRGMTDRVWGTQTNSTTGATTNLNLSFGNGSDIARFAGQRATQAAIDAGIRTAIAGGSFGDHLGDGLENAVAHVVSGVLFNAVGDLANEQLWQEGAPQKIALHALIGGSVSEAMGGDFATGALAAGASEALVHALVSDTSRAEFSNAAAQIVGIVAAELAGGDVNDGAFIAGQVESYNRQLHTAERELARDLAESSDGQFTLEEIESALRGLPNHALGEGPYDNIHVPLQPGLDPEEMGYYDFGAEWVQVQYADGSHGIVQAIPNVPRDDLYAFIVEQTGGRNSPYWTPAPNRGVPVPRESQPVFPGSIAMASGLPYNLNSPDLRTPEQQQQDMEAFVFGTSSLAAVPFGTAYVSMLGARSAIGYFGVGASFDLAGQGIQESDYRFGQTMMAGGTSLLFGPMASSSIIGNAILGGAAGGTHTSATNWLYDENRSVGQSALLGAGAGGVGTYIGGTIGQRLQGLPRQVSVPVLQTPANITMPLPSAEAVGNTTDTVISNMPALINLPDAGNSEDRSE